MIDSEGIVRLIDFDKGRKIGLPEDGKTVCEERASEVSPDIDGAKRCWQSEFPV